MLSLYQVPQIKVAHLTIHLQFQPNTSQTVTGTITVNSANATQSYTINVTAQNSSNYQLSGNDRNGNVTGNDPTVTINLGDTLTFNVMHKDIHFI